MRGLPTIIAAAAICVMPTAANADASDSFASGRGAAASGSELPPYLQCVPYARQLSGIQIYGDALTWWEQAAGRYERGHTPQVGAVMAFQPYRNMTLGHVAAVSRVVDSRTVLLDHANWSPIDGRRGQIERNVTAVDVSPANDWSQVRVWYDPIHGLGTTAWPVQGFIYSKQAKLAQTRLAAVQPAPYRPATPAPVPMSPTPSRAFMSAFAGMEASPARIPQSKSPVARLQRAAVQTPQPQAMPQRKAAAAPRDSIALALARYGN